MCTFRDLMLSFRPPASGGGALEADCKSAICLLFVCYVEMLVILCHVFCVLVLYDVYVYGCVCIVVCFIVAAHAVYCCAYCGSAMHTERPRGRRLLGEACAPPAERASRWAPPPKARASAGVRTRLAGPTRNSVYDVYAVYIELVSSKRCEQIIVWIIYHHSVVYIDVETVK